MRLMVRASALLLLLTTLLLGSAALAAAQEGTPSGQEGEEVVDGEQEPCADLRPWEQPACRVREGLSSGVGTIVAAGFGSVFDQLYEWVAAGAAWLLGQLVSLIDSSTRPHAGAEWFGHQYRLMASLAVALVLPLLLVSTVSGVVRQDWRGLVRSYFVYLPAAMIGTAVAVPLVDLGLGLTDWMSSLFLDGMREDIEGFVGGVAEALVASPAGAAATASAGVAPFLMFMAASLIALGAFAVWVELVLRAAGIYVALFFLPLGFAALVWPATRKWFGRLVKALVALILSKFVIVAVIALASAALGNLTTADGTAFGGVVAGSALMLMAAFSPLVLFRVADVAGDEVATAIEGVTQHRSSPVPTPAPQQSASRVYGRIMQSRSARDHGAAVTGSRNGAASVAGSTASAAGGPATAAGPAAAAAATAVKAPRTAGESAGQRLAEAAGPGEQQGVQHATPVATGTAGRPGGEGPSNPPARAGETAARARPDRTGSEELRSRADRAPGPRPGAPGPGGAAGEAVQRPHDSKGPAPPRLEHPRLPPPPEPPPESR